MTDRLLGVETRDVSGDRLNRGPRRLRVVKDRYLPRVATCANCGIDRPVAASEWCHRCYQRWVRHGRPTEGPPEPRQLQGCGTDAAYQRHIKNGEPVDDGCRQARNAAQKERRAKARTRSAVSARTQWTAEQTCAAYTTALAADSPTERRLLLEVLGLIPASAPTVMASFATTSDIAA